MKSLVLAALLLASAPAAAEGPLSKESKLAPAAKATPMADAAARQAMLAEADSYRRTALRAAARKLSKLKGQLATGADPSFYDADTVKFVKSWLNAVPADKDYSDTLTTAISAIVMNRALEPSYTVFPESKKFCDDAQKAAKGAGANAYNLKGSIYLCEPWVRGSAECRRVVVIHEVFHTVGLLDLDAAFKFPARTTAQALTDAAYMAGLASQLHSKAEDSCP